MTTSRAEAVAALTAPGAAYELVDEVVDGVPLRVYRTEITSLRDLLDDSERFGQRDFLVLDDEHLTYAEHARQARALAATMATRWGVGPGDRVAIAMRNWPEWSVAFFAAQQLGAVAVPLNGWWTGEELAYGLADSGAAVLVADGERLDRLAGSPALQGIRGLVGCRGAATGTAWDEATTTHEAPPRPPIGVDDPATILYTSGTTGRSKGAIGTHRNHVTNLLNVRLRQAVPLVQSGRDPAELLAQHPVPLQTYPFFHIAGLTHLYGAISRGSTAVLLYRWDLDRAVELIDRHGVTALACVPTLLHQLFDPDVLPRLDLSKVTSIGSGGSSLDPDLVGRISAATGGRVVPNNSYGLTETTSAVTINGGAEHLAHPDSVGPALPGTDLRTCDEDGRDVPVGEIWVRGPTVVRGYWNRPAETALAFTDGWFHTGDVGHVTDDGFLVISDRLKDVIVRGGENVYSAEVESVLYEHPAVADVAVIGVPHPTLGEEVVAVVVPRASSTLTPDDVRSFVAGRLAAFKVPAHVTVTAEPLPRTPSGKVLKRELRARTPGGTS